MPVPPQLGSMATIVSGVGIVLAPRLLRGISPARLMAGALLAVVLAIGQGSGALLSRRAFAVLAVTR